MAEFPVPEFLQDCDIDTIHNKMLAQLPKDIDRTQAGFLWDFTRPTALIASELLEFYAIEFLKLIFPQYSYGEYLDLIGHMAQVDRKAANKATVTLTVTGVAGTAIPSGTVFCTEDDADVASIEFETTAPYTIDGNGAVSVIAVAVEAGTESNVDQGTIVLMSEPINGIESVINDAAASGGTKEESDDDYRERIMDATTDNDASFIGNKADYKRWAESVQGMGTAIVMFNWNGPETIKIVCTDANGVAANQTILDAIYDLIMSPDDEMERLAPPNTILTVAAPTFVNVSYSFSVVLKDGFTSETIVNSFKEGLATYYKTVPTEKVLRYSIVGRILSETDGVEDYKDLLINGSAANIDIDEDEYPSTTTVTATVISEV